MPCWACSSQETHISIHSTHTVVYRFPALNKLMRSEHDEDESSSADIRFGTQTWLCSCPALLHGCCLKD